MTNSMSAIARGEASLQHSDMHQIAKLLCFEEIRPEFLPTEALSSRSLKARKMAIALLAEKLWPVSTQKWLQYEKDWLQDVRRRNGNSNDDGKDDLDHIVSQEILVRIYTVAYLYHRIAVGKIKVSDGDADIILHSSLRSLNTYLQTVCSKGYTRAQPIFDANGESTSVYGFLVGQGIPVAGTGHYLPDPEKTLPHLITYLSRDSMRPEIFLK